MQHAARRPQQRHPAHGGLHAQAGRQRRGNAWPGGVLRLALPASTGELWGCHATPRTLRVLFRIPSHSPLFTTPKMQASELAGVSEAELQEKAKRKGRFRYVEDDYAGGAGAGGMAGSKTVSGLGSK